MEKDARKTKWICRNRRALLYYKIIHRYAVHVEKKKPIVCEEYMNPWKSEREREEVRRKKERMKVDAYVLGTILVT